MEMRLDKWLWGILDLRRRRTTFTASRLTNGSSSIFLTFGKGIA